MNSNITNNTNGSIKELKNQVLNDIQRVKDDLQEIKRRATPGQIIDDVIFSRREYGTEGTFDLLKANPIGTTFLTLGTLMLMENDAHHTWESVGKEKSGAAIGRFIAAYCRGTISAHGDARGFYDDSRHDKVRHVWLDYRY